MPNVSLSELVAAARTGDRLVSFPTDTVPALAVRPDRSSLIFEAKQRDLQKPLILMGATAEDLWQYVEGSKAEFAQWKQVAAKYFPGALTLVLPASDRLPPEVNPTDSTTVGIRVPNRAIARHILSLTAPLATTSVNRSGEPPLQTTSEINAQFPEILTLLPAELEAETKTTLPPTLGTPSTVVRWTGESWTVLRQGSVQFRG
ncbi:L-threonylcarbamoyladenylate synthase [Phormidium tenue FACHB-886]|nr:L-threonylcarbamoyladenylate synthase [Phormidium tenue FACHB-886]